MKKILSKYIRILFCLLAFSFLQPLSAQVPPKPLWVKKGVTQLNRHRLNHSYEFVAFHHELTNQSIIPDNQADILRLNMAKHFNVNPHSITIDTISDPELNRTTYSVSFPAHDEEEITRVYVQPVDSYQRYDDNIDGSYDYILDQLYAISEKDTTPSFDNFEVTRKYNGIPVAMSLIPGLGQIYKGQAAKGYAILGSEVFFCAAIAYGEINRAYYMKKAHKNPGNFESWKSKANTFRTVRNIGIVFASATYLYNILDAALAKGAPHVIISRKNLYPADLVISPQASPWHFGASLAFTF